jgi:hypothetical protein
LTQNVFCLRDRLSEQLKGIRGVLSVGTAKREGLNVLVVSVDPDEFTGGVPAYFGGVRVVVRNLGRPVGHAVGGAWK